MSTDKVDTQKAAGLIFRLEDKPPFGPSLLAATQHLLAALIAIVAPTLIIGNALELDDYLPYLVSMALFVSGVGTYIQSKTIGPVGSGLLTLQGTSFTFVPAIIAAGMAVKTDGGAPEDILAMIVGLTLAGSLLPIVLSRFIDVFRRVITPTTTGSIITIVGLSLIALSMKDMAGIDDNGAAQNAAGLWTGLFVIVVIVALSFAPNAIVRMAAILTGIIAGCALAGFLGMIDTSAADTQTLVVVPIPFRFGIDFSLTYFLPIMLIYLVTIVEAVGDMTANSVIVGEPIKGDTYMRRIRAGVLGDGVSSAIASVFGTFPNTTFSQNNGVIQITGIGSRHIAIYLSLLLVAAGLIPFIGNLLTLIPRPVLGGATLIMFASIAVAGIRILSCEPFTRKRIYVISLSLGFGLGVALVPEALQPLPEVLQRIFGSPITTTGIVAVLSSLVIPDTVPEGT
ncbi:MAG: solute carrier family 23 protein [Pseudomonadota bacterium]